MSKRPRDLSIEQSAWRQPCASVAIRPVHHTVLPRLHMDRLREPRKIPVEHLPSPAGPIQFRVALENLSIPTTRLPHRQFCDRLRLS
jgi:hypothetical protein